MPWLRKKIGEVAEKKVLEDKKAAEALRKALKDMQEDAPKWEKTNTKRLLGMWRGDLRPEKEITNYPEDED